MVQAKYLVLTLLILLSVGLARRNSLSNIPSTFELKERQKIKLTQEENQEIYTGYIQVRDSGSRLFYHLYTPFKKSIDEQNSIIIYLDGTTGFGRSTILHPITGYSADYVTEGTTQSAKISTRPPLFTNNHFVLMIDQPLGTGYSVVGNDDDLKSDEKQIIQDLNKFFQGFYRNFGELIDNRVILIATGQMSRFAPEIYELLDNLKVTNSRSEIQDLNMFGLILISPWISSYHQLNWDSAARATGLIDKTTQLKIRKDFTNTRFEILREKKEQSNDLYKKSQDLLKQLQSLASIKGSDIIDKTKYIDFYCFNQIVIKRSTDIISSAAYSWATIAENKKIMGVPEQLGFVQFDEEVANSIIQNEWSVENNTKWNNILKDSHILIVNGQLDIVHNTVGLQNWLTNLQELPRGWAYIKPRPFSAISSIDGISKQTDKLWFSTVYNSGAYIAEDSLEVLDKVFEDWKHFIDGKIINPFLVHDML